MLTPNDLDVLIHFCVCPAPHERQSAPAVQESIKMFVDSGLLELSCGLTRNGYIATEKGHAHLRQLCSIQFPSQAWVDTGGNIIK